jgi:poly(beta-D-mannuronate) lyase
LRFEDVLTAPIISLNGGAGRVTECTFQSSGAADHHSRHLVRADSEDNRIDHNEFVDCLSKCTGVWGARLRNRIDHNAFRALRRFGQEEVEAIQIGQSSHYVPTYTLIEHNLFDHANGTGEIVSIKTSGATVRYNTFIDSRGALTLRAGNGSRAEGNVFIRCQDGIRVYGSDHVILNNVMIDSEQRGIFLNSPDSNHEPPNRCLVAHNTIVGASEAGIRIGFRDGTPPRDIHVVNNLITSDRGRMLQIERASDHVIERNLLWATGSGTVGFSGSEAIEEDPLLGVEAEAVWLTASSPAIDRALALDDVAVDRLGVERPVGPASDLGAQEYGGSIPASDGGMPAPDAEVDPGMAPSLSAGMPAETDAGVAQDHDAEMNHPALEDLKAEPMSMQDGCVASPRSDPTDFRLLASLLVLLLGVRRACH